MEFDRTKNRACMMRSVGNWERDLMRLERDALETVGVDFIHRVVFGQAGDTVFWRYDAD